MFALHQCSVCGCDVHAGPGDPRERCPRCGSLLAKHDASPVRCRLAPNRWGDVLVIASLAVLAYLVHAMLWREFFP